MPKNQWKDFMLVQMGDNLKENHWMLDPYNKLSQWLQEGIILYT